MQCQEPPAPFYGLWSRLERFEAAELVRLLESHAVLRTTLMRATLHLTTADDFLAWRPMHQAMLEKRFAGSGFMKQLDGVDVAEVSRPAARRWPRRRARPRRSAGRWRSAGPTTTRPRSPTPCASACRSRSCRRAAPRSSARAGRPWSRRWRTLLGRPLATETAPDALLLRYLAAFGPASVADMRMWSGLPGLAAAVDAPAPGAARLPRRARPRAARPPGRADRHGRGARPAALPAVVRQHPARPRRPLARAALRAPARRRRRQRVRARRRLRPRDLADRARRRRGDPARPAARAARRRPTRSSPRASGCSRSRHPRPSAALSGSRDEHRHDRRLDQLPPVRRGARRRGGEARGAARLRRVVGGRLAARARHPPDPRGDVDAHRGDGDPQRLGQRSGRDGGAGRRAAGRVPRPVRARHRHRPPRGDERLPAAADGHARVPGRAGRARRRRRRPRSGAWPRCARRCSSSPATRSAGAHTYFVPVEHTRSARERLGPGSAAGARAGLRRRDRPRARQGRRPRLREAVPRAEQLHAATCSTSASRRTTSPTAARTA